MFINIYTWIFILSKNKDPHPSSPLINFIIILVGTIKRRPSPSTSSLSSNSSSDRRGSAIQLTKFGM
jgi:hypothetical protein